MAISVAAAYVNNDGGTSVTSGNFSVAVDDLIVVVAHCDTNNDTANVVWVLSDNQAPDLVFTLISERDGSDGDGGGVIAWYRIITGNLATYNVSVAVSAGTDTADSPAVKVYKFANGDYDAADVIGALAEGSLTTDPQNTASITPETAGTGIAAWTDWNQTGVPTSSNLTMTGFNTAGDIAGGSGYRALTAGVGATANINSGAAPTGNYLWFEIRAGAGAGGALTGASSVGFAATGTLTGAGALSGSAALSFAPTALIRGNAPISGSASLAFSPSATLTGAGALSGTATVAFSPSASLTGAGALVGATTLSFAPSAALTATGALTGSATVTFNVAGTLTNDVAGAISGASSISFTAVGVLTGIGSLAGTTTLTFAPSGTLADGSAPPIPEPQVQTPAGSSRSISSRSSQHKQKRRYYVEIDGQSFPVHSAAEATHLLHQARAIAEREAEQKAAVAVKRLSSKPRVPVVRVAAPAITASPELDLAPLIADIERLYAKAAQTAELQLLMAKQIEEDDDEDDLLLLI